MRIWGYILIFLNLVAACAFFYFGYALWVKRTEFQYALLRQELVNRGLPLEGPKKSSDETPDEVDEDSVPIDFKLGPNEFGAARIERLSPKQINAMIPKGGAVLGLRATDKLVTDQTSEVKRVEKIVFEDLDKIMAPDERRIRLMILLLNLAKADEREGTYALLRDYLVENRRTTARWEMALLGRTPTQVSALRTLSVLGEAQLAFLPNQKPEEKAIRLRAGRKALIGWALAEIPNATPDPLPPTIPPPPSDEPVVPANPEKDRLIGALQALAPAMEADPPDAANIAGGKKRLLELLEGDEALTGRAATVLIPFIADIGTNMLENEAQLGDARAKLLELLLARARSQAEKKSLEATVELMVPAKLPPDPMAVEQQVDTVATELLRSYFEEAIDPPSLDLPVDTTAARTKLAELKPLRDQEEKRRNIAHLLYHLDAHVGFTAEARMLWYNAFMPPPAKDVGGPGAMRAADEDVLKNRADWHKRVVAVVGLESYVPVVEAQATQLNRMIGRINERILIEQSLFEGEYQAVVAHALYLAGQLQIREAYLAGQQLNLDDIKKQLAIRIGERNALKTELAKVTAEATTALKALEVKVDELFQITKQLGDAQDSLVDLELKLRDMELGPKDKKK